VHERIGHDAEHDGQRDDACSSYSSHQIDCRAYTTADDRLLSSEPLVVVEPMAIAGLMS
jgi:hypothetical protein